MPRLRLLIALPALAVRLMLLVGRQSIHPVPREDAVHRGPGDLEPMEPEQIRGNPRRAEMIMLAQVKNLAHHVARRRSGRSLRRSGSIAQASVPVCRAALFPLVERLPGNTPSAANPRDVPAVLRLLQDL